MKYGCIAKVSYLAGREKQIVKLVIAFIDYAHNSTAYRFWEMKPNPILESKGADVQFVKRTIVKLEETPIMK